MRRAVTVVGGTELLDFPQTFTISRARRHLERAINEAAKSPDPATQVGAVLVSPASGGIISWGCNTLPHGIEPTVARMHVREIKLKLIVHAEVNAILSAARTGRMTDGGTLYLAATDETGLCWGGPPCCACTLNVIQAGIRRVVSFEQKRVPSKWHADLAIARNLLAEAGVELIEVPFA
jgi:dCMP deaminase